MEQQPKLLELKRQTIAHLGAAKVGLEALAGVSITGTGVSAAATWYGGGKVELLIPLIGSMLGGLSLLIRAVISYYLNVAQVENPLPATTS
ncbi:hypothetical protein [Spirosoma sp.]|uniref:hypothetical protein n=1 Tax=Spirosoma sp. TaxID=1899569 RepID=UPI003B3AADB7